MVIVPLRAIDEAFAATVNAFGPLPLPLMGGVIVIHEAFGPVEPRVAGLRFRRSSCHIGAFCRQT